jgi:hypothetical protein
LCTVGHSIATARLRHFLKSFEAIYQILGKMFTVVPNFRLLLMPSLDRHLQNFYDMVSEMEDVNVASPYDRAHLKQHADDLV